MKSVLKKSFSIDPEKYTWRAFVAARNCRTDFTRRFVFLLVDLGVFQIVRLGGNVVVCRDAISYGRAVLGAWRTVSSGTLFAMLKPTTAATMMAATAAIAPATMPLPFLVVKNCPTCDAALLP